MSHIQHLNTIIKAAVDAGKAILEVYNTDFDVKTKDDQTPLTQADLRSHEVIKQALDSTEIPVLSEEGRALSFEERKSWEKLWIVDPLDGTKEFVKKNGEFTVNIALAVQGKPVMGVIYIPVTETLYFAEDSLGAYKVVSPQNFDYDKLMKNGDKLPAVLTKKNFTMVGSRSHMSAETEDYMKALKEQHGEVDVISCGSSIKLCMVAEGKADVYPRFAPTMEWDTAAGHAICSAAGCVVLNNDTQQELDYNKENLLNPWFLVKR